MSKYDYARLRPLEVKQLVQEGQPFFYLRDPLELSSHYALVPQVLGSILLACDGLHTVSAMQKTFQNRMGAIVSEDEIETLLSQLDDIYLLDNERADQAMQAALAAYRAASHRPPAIAGQSYPADPEALSQVLQGYMAQIAETGELEEGRGLISPHIDYFRGGLVYAQVWKRVAKLAREADCVIFLGTDHKSAIPAQITLTRQNYATPFGVLPTSQPVVDAIASVLGEAAVFESELHHRDEWAIELAAVWLHFIRDGVSCPIVPILCGSFHHFIQNGDAPADDAQLNAMIKAIQTVTADQKILVVAAGDLAHLGPAFDGPPIDALGRQQLRVDDDKLLAPVCVGDADSFFEIIRQDRGSRNVCGTSSIYLAMKIMGDVQGEKVSYDCCLADEQETSFVSVCGVTFA